MLLMGMPLEPLSLAETCMYASGFLLISFQVSRLIRIVEIAGEYNYCLKLEPKKLNEPFILTTSRRLVAGFVPICYRNIITLLVF